jgi:hypothetical protein
MDDQQKTADARADLLESGDEDAQKAVHAWEKRNSHENEVGGYLEIGGRRLGPFYTFGEISLKNRASWIRDEMDRSPTRIIPRTPRNLASAAAQVKKPVAPSHHFTLISLPDCVTSKEGKREQ